MKINSEKIIDILYVCILGFIVVAIFLKSLFFGNNVPSYMNDMLMVIVGCILGRLFPKNQTINMPYLIKEGGKDNEKPN